MRGQDTGKGESRSFQELFIIDFIYGKGAKKKTKPLFLYSMAQAVGGFSSAKAGTGLAVKVP